METTADQSTLKRSRFVLVLRFLSLHIGLPVAVYGLFAVYGILNYGMSIDEALGPFVIWLMPLTASFTCGGAFGKALRTNGWRKMLLPLIGYLALVSLLGVPMLIMRFSFAVPLFCALFLSFFFMALLIYLHAWSRDLWGTGITPRAWTRPRR